MKQKAKKAKKRVVKQKLGYKKLGYKASKAKPIAKGSMHCNPNASLVESNDRIFSRSIIDLSYWALVVNTLHWCIIDEKKKFPREILVDDCKYEFTLTDGMNCVNSHDRFTRPSSKHHELCEFTWPSSIHPGQTEVLKIK